MRKHKQGAFTEQVRDKIVEVLDSQNIIDQVLVEFIIKNTVMNLIMAGILLPIIVLPIK